MWTQNEKESLWWKFKKKITKAQEGTKTESDLKGLSYDMAARNAERNGYPNKAKNLKFKAKAEYNQVTDVPSFFNELKYRWMSNPWLGGKIEEDSFMAKMLKHMFEPSPLYIPQPSDFFKKKKITKLNKK